MPSPISGVLDSISVKEGETVNVGSLLGTVDKSINDVVDKTKASQIIIARQRKKMKKQN